ncbi:hypothetical protein predicted by Glimmer/Critica [Salmonella enterica subsp. enterica serovar Weltevreden str. 2007-60-3289-1]|nr:hypothetical protein predicted by Glimmer/Critica [Salmonella enterica subsp. enterica serovar Weltevreden str. 2007-60-3289-1]
MATQPSPSGTFSLFSYPHYFILTPLLSMIN